MASEIALKAVLDGNPSLLKSKLSLSLSLSLSLYWRISGGVGCKSLVFLHFSKPSLICSILGRNPKKSFRMEKPQF
jgi:hypothetical protein